ncbi:MAG: hypothetical protein ABI867_12000 [Kofleriaceae bacterium]
MPRKRMLLATSLLAGCGTPAQPALRQDIVEPAQRDPAHEAVRALARDAVHHDRFARAELYTWTTVDQIAELQRTRKLLVRDESPVFGASYIDQVLYVLAQRGDPVAKLLYTSAFAKMRFAWPSPWATRFGWPREEYGDRLIRITLRPEALIVTVSTATGTFEARNLLNEVVPLATVLAKPETVAAIYFVSDAKQASVPGIPAATASFREYAVCNEAMVASWEVGTDRIAKVLGENADALEAMSRYVEAKPASVANTSLIATAWPRGLTDPSPELAYVAAMAFDSTNYDLKPLLLADHAHVLRLSVDKPAFEGRPTTTFAAGAVRPPPRVVKNPGSAYATYISPSPTAAKP